jgi:hypothetical protein
MKFYFYLVLASLLVLPQANAKKLFNKKDKSSWPECYKYKKKDGTIKTKTKKHCKGKWRESYSSLIDSDVAKAKKKCEKKKEGTAEWITEGLDNKIKFGFCKKSKKLKDRLANGVRGVKGLLSPSAQKKCQKFIWKIKGNKDGAAVLADYGLSSSKEKPHCNDTTTKIEAKYIKRLYKCYNKLKKVLRKSKHLKKENGTEFTLKDVFEVASGDDAQRSVRCEKGKFKKFVNYGKIGGVVGATILFGPFAGLITAGAMPGCTRIVKKLNKRAKTKESKDLQKEYDRLLGDSGLTNEILSKARLQKLNITDPELCKSPSRVKMSHIKAVAKCFGKKKRYLVISNKTKKFKCVSASRRTKMAGKLVATADTTANGGKDSPEEGPEGSEVYATGNDSKAYKVTHNLIGLKGEKFPKATISLKLTTEVKHGVSSTTVAKDNTKDYKAAQKFCKEKVNNNRMVVSCSVSSATNKATCSDFSCGNIKRFESKKDEIIQTNVSTSMPEMVKTPASLTPAQKIEKCKAMAVTKTSNNSDKTAKFAVKTSGTYKKCELRNPKPDCKCFKIEYVACSNDLTKKIKHTSFQVQDKKKWAFSSAYKTSVNKTYPITDQSGYTASDLGTSCGYYSNSLWNGLKKLGTDIAYKGTEFTRIRKKLDNFIDKQPARSSKIVTTTMNFACIQNGPRKIFTIKFLGSDHSYKNTALSIGNALVGDFNAAAARAGHTHVLEVVDSKKKVAPMGGPATAWTTIKKATLDFMFSYCSKD